MVKLEICNLVLNGLSPTVNTEFRGEVMLIISKIFSICDKSAVNLKGKYNTENTTNYESIEQVQEENDVSETDY